MLKNVKKIRFKESLKKNSQGMFKKLRTWKIVAKTSKLANCSVNQKTSKLANYSVNQKTNKLANYSVNQKSIKLANNSVNQKSIKLANYRLNQKTSKLANYSLNQKTSKLANYSVNQKSIKLANYRLNQKTGEYEDDIIETIKYCIKYQANILTSNLLNILSSEIALLTLHNLVFHVHWTAKNHNLSIKVVSYSRIFL